MIIRAHLQYEKLVQAFPFVQYPVETYGPNKDGQPSVYVVHTSVINFDCSYRYPYVYGQVCKVTAV